MNNSSSSNWNSRVTLQEVPPSSVQPSHIPAATGARGHIPSPDVPQAAASENVMLDGAHTVPTIPNSQADVIMPDLPPPLDNPDNMIIKPTGNVSKVIADSKELKQKIKLMTWPLKELQ